MSLHADISHQRDAFSLDIALRVRDGETLALLGPNGSGKSTTLRCLAGLERPSRGVVEIAGTIVEDTSRDVDVPPEGRSVGYVFQDYLLFPHMSVLDNVAFGPRSRGASRREAETSARNWLMIRQGDLLALANGRQRNGPFVLTQAQIDHCRDSETSLRSQSH